MAKENYYDAQLKAWAERRRKIRERYAILKSLTAVATEFRITKGRVFQIVNGK